MLGLAMGLLVAAVMCGASPWPVSAAEHLPGFPESPFLTAEGRARKLIIEQEYSFVEFRYEPAVELDLKQSRNPSYATPEDAAASYFRAMSAGNFEAAQAAWTPEARDENRQRDEAKGWGPEFWRKTWRRALEGNRVRLVKRVETGLFAIVEYELVPVGREDVILREVLVFRWVGGDQSRWLLSNELADDPVRSQLKTEAAKAQAGSEEIRIRKVVR